MKNLFTFFLVLFNLVLVSCEKEVVKENILNIPKDSLSFDAEGEEQTVSFVSNDIWRAYSNQSWCSVSPTSGDATDNNTCFPDCFL